MIDTMLRVYFVLHLTVAIAYCFYWWTSPFLFQRPKASLRWGQGLLLLSLVLPVAASWVPARQMAHFPMVVLPPLAEVGYPLRRLNIEGKSVKIMSPSTDQKADGSSPLVFNWEVSQILVIGLCVGILGAFVLKAMAILRLARHLSIALPIRRLGQVTVVASNSFSVPVSALLGRRAWVAIPENMLSHGRDFHLAIRHELQHHRQGDTHWAIFMEILSCILIGSPFLTLFRKRITEFQEFSCDEALIGRNVSSHEYGACLVRVAEAALKTTTRLAGTASMAAGFENPKYFKSLLRRRIEMLFDSSQKKSSSLLWLVMGTLAVTSTIAFALGAERALRKMETSEASAIPPGEVWTEPVIQSIADKALQSALKRFKASLGFIVVADPVTGKILAVANRDNVETQADRTPHWALSLRVGLASISKAIFTAGALERGVTAVDEIHNCENGHYDFGTKHYRDWKPFDKLTTADTVIHSSNICGIKVGQKLGVSGLEKVLADFGFGPKGITEGIAETRPGEIPDSKRVDASYYVATVSTGYNGLYASPIEVVQAMGAIANGGKLMKPLVGSGNENPVMLRRVLAEETSSQMKKILAQVMTRGTAQGSSSKLYVLGGKTATGYSRTHVEHDSLGGDSNMASFVGFGPVENPRVVVYVGVENPSDGTGVHGSTHAAPVFKEVAEKVLQYLKVPPKG